MNDTPDLKTLVGDAECLLANIEQGLGAAQTALMNLPDDADSGDLHFIIDALETRHQELREHWKAVHAAVFRSAE